MPAHEPDDLVRPEDPADQDLIQILKEARAFPRVRSDRAESALARILASANTHEGTGEVAGPGARWRPSVLVTASAGVMAVLVVTLAVVLATWPQAPQRVSVPSAAEPQATLEGRTGAGAAPADSPATHEYLASALDGAFGEALARLPSSSEPSPVEGLPEGHPARRWAGLGILPTAGSTFSPQVVTTRGELVMALYEAGERLGVGSGGVDTRQRYEDVPPDHFAFRAVADLSPSIVPPRDQSTFGVADPVTRETVDKSVSETVSFFKMASELLEREVRARSGEGGGGPAPAAP